MNDRHRRDECLDRRTLETLAAGRCPIDQAHKLRSHLPRCSKCRAAIVASSGRRPRGGDTVLLAPGYRALAAEPAQPQLAQRVALMLLALLSVGVAVWFTAAGANVREVVERSLLPGRARAQAPAALSGSAAPQPSVPQPSVSQPSVPQPSVPQPSVRQGVAPAALELR